ncbi:hypothetical protein FEQ05_06814 [Burkholderia pseudomultivorans]|nr:hypothetical protein [Burkholderia pseudomultivorans]MDR8823057.1 hypothetical protein [Burkholderia pseudomultivorans]
MLCSTSANGAGTCTGRAALGTIHSTTPIARIDSTPTIANSPLIPTQWNTIGAPTIATANDMPIEPPTIAIAFVRFCSEVRSAMNASTADDTAPIPWITRPTMIHVMSCANAATKLPSAKISRPVAITGLRPNLSDAHP